MTSASPEPRANPARRSSKQLAIYALFTGGVAIGCVPIFVRLSEVGPSATAFWRVLLALPVFLAWMFLERKGVTGVQGRLSVRFDGWAGLFFAADLTVWRGQSI
jgi:hypothetical protein